LTPVTAAIRLGATPLSIDEHGVPRLLRGGPALVAPDATTAARMHVERLAPAWGVKPGAMPAMTALGEVAMPGGTIVRLRQLIDGIPIDPAQGGELRVMVGADGSLLGASGKVVGTNTPHPSVASFAIDEATAVARAVTGGARREVTGDRRLADPRRDQRAAPGLDVARPPDLVRGRRAWQRAARGLHRRVRGQRPGVDGQRDVPRRGRRR
jgi:hypothetical protein